MITLNQRRLKVGICSCPFSHNIHSPIYPMQKNRQSCTLSNQKLKPTDKKPTINDLKNDNLTVDFVDTIIFNSDCHWILILSKEIHTRIKGHHLSSEIYLYQQ